jgi:hypothetical protein
MSESMGKKFTHVFAIAETRQLFWVQTLEREIVQVVGVCVKQRAASV